MGIFGSNYETRDTVGFIPLFNKEPNGEHDYWQNTVGQAYAQSGGELDSNLLGSYLTQVNKYVSYAAYEKLGGTAETNILLVGIDDGSVDDIVSSNPDYTSTHSTNYVGTFSVVDPGTPVYVLNARYGTNGKNCGDLSDTYQWSWNNISIDTIHYASDNNGATITITMSDATVIQEPLPLMIDAYNIYYNGSDGCVHTQSTSADSIETDGGTDGHALFVRYKVAGIINEDIYIKAINARIGIPNQEPPEDPDNPSPPEAQTMQEMLEDSETIMYGITYAAKYEEPFIEIINRLKALGSYTVYIEGIDGTPEAGTIFYQQGTIQGIDGGVDPLTGLVCYINNNLVKYIDADGNVDENISARYIIPLEEIEKMTMMDKYDAVQNALCFVIHKQTKTRLKWYQTRLFQIVLWVAAFALAATGNPTMLVGMAATTMAKAINDDLAIIIGIVFAVYTLGTGLVSSGTTMAGNFANLTKLVEAVSRYYFSQEFKQLQAEVDAGNEENADILDQLKEFQQRGIFMPLDRIGAYADTVTESLYNMYDVVFETENYMQLPSTTP